MWINVLFVWHGNEPRRVFASWLNGSRRPKMNAVTIDQMSNSIRIQCYLRNNRLILGQFANIHGYLVSRCEEQSKIFEVIRCTIKSLKASYYRHCTVYLDWRYFKRNYFLISHRNNKYQLLTHSCKLWFHLKHNIWIYALNDKRNSHWHFTLSKRYACFTYSGLWLTLAFCLWT